MDDEITSKISDLNQLTENLYLQGKQDDALIAAQQSVDLSRNTFGENHPDYASSLNNLAGIYYSIGAHQKAEPFYIQAREICGKALGEDHPDYATSLNNLAALYQAMGAYQKAEPLHIQALEIRKNILGIDHPDYATSLNNLAVLYQVVGAYQKAEPLHIQALEIRKNILGIDHLDYAASINNLAVLYQLMGAYQKAEPFYIQAREICKKSLGEAHPNYATSLNNLAVLYQLMGAYQKAEPFYIQAREICGKALGEDHPDYATSLNNLAALYQAMGAYQKAELLYIQAREICGKALGEDHPDYATSLNNLGILYQQIGAYQKAEQFYIQTQEILKKSIGMENPVYATCLNNMALCYQMIGAYQKAEPIYIQSLEIRKNILGIDHPDYAASINNLAALYQVMGAYQKAEQFYIEAMGMRKKILGENHPDYATSLNNLGLLYQGMGAYNKAQSFCMQALEIRKNILGIDHPDYATSLNSIAGLYQLMGAYQKAEQFYIQAQGIRKKILGENHPDYADSLNKLAELYEFMGAYQKAAPLYIQAMEIREKALGIDHPDYANSLKNLAGVCQEIGSYQDAEFFHVLAQGIREKVLGKDHPSYASDLYSLAGFYKFVGSNDTVEHLYIQVGEIWKKTLGNKHPQYGSYLRNLAILYAATNRLNEAIMMMKEASVIEDLKIEEVFSISSENQRLAYLSSELRSAEIFVSLVMQQLDSHPDTIKDALSFVLKRKSITAEAITAQRHAIISGKYPHLREQLDQLNVLRMQIARKQHAYPGKEGLDVYHQILEGWNSKKEDIEAELSRQIPEMRIEQNIKNADRTLIANSLPSESILLEFLRYNEYDFKAVRANGEKQYKPARYCVFVLPAGQSDDVKLIDLGDAVEIDRLITTYKSKLTVDGRALSEKEYPDHPANAEPKILSRLSLKKKSAGKQRSRIAPITMKIYDQTQSDMGIYEGLDLYSRLIAPIKAAIGICRHLVIAPDSQLSLIPFEVIPTPEGGYFADQYHISYVGVGRDILRFATQIPGQSENALVMASPDFDLVAGKRRKISKLSHENGRRSRDFSKSSKPYLPLEGAKLEGKNIGKLLGIKPLLEGDALEGRLKSVSSPHILHIATHGFFLEDQEMPANKADLGLGMQGERVMQRLSGAGIENPMLRSGLVLAGVNTWMKNGELPLEAEDGVLTAEDVTALDLANTDLVVLSACETGLGDVKVGEGVFGLRRAFAIAGAKTLVMSLWKVPDDCTQELMEDFYRRILAGTPKAEALREAQLKLREKYPHPRDWGGFICQGDPGPVPMCKSPQ